MMYLHATTSPNVWKNADKSKFGFITSPRNGAVAQIEDGYKWAIDNGAFTGVFDEDRYFYTLKRYTKYLETCLFAVCPDTLCDSVETLSKWDLYSDRIKSIGYPVAFVCQNGQENLPIPDNYDVLFIGGSDEWRVAGCGAIECIRKAKASGKWVHVGRVNSLKRVKHFMLEGVDSVDGTYVSFGPDKNYKSPMKWMAHQPLWKGEL